MPKWQKVNMKKLIRWIKARNKTFLTGAMSVFFFAVAGASSALAAEPPPASNAVTFSGVSLPFTVPDMLSTATNFLGMYGQWVLLALGVLFAPVLYGLAMKLISAVRSKMSH